jgi:cell division protein FtsQ
MKEQGIHISKAVIVGIILAVLTGVILLASALFRVTSITYEGNTHYTDEEMTDFIFSGKLHTNALLYSLLGKRQEKAVIPFIQDYDVEVIWPDQLKVSVYEKDIIGFISYMGCNMYFDKDGIIVDSSQEILDGVPEVTGIAYRNIVLHEKLDTEEDKFFSIMLDLVQLLDKYEIEIDKVYFDAELNVTIYMDDIRVQLGDSDLMTEKVHELSMMLPELEGRSGVLYLNSFNEDTNSIIFKKDSEE